MDDLFDILNRPDPDELIRRLTPKWVIQSYGIGFNEDDQALCPFHADTNPSLYLWQGDDGVQRWWCQPCGFGGRIFDFIMRWHSCTFPEAVEHAAQILANEPPDFVAPVAPPKARPDVSIYRAEIDRAKEYAATKPGLISALVGLAPANNQSECERWDINLRNTWQWGLTEDGAITVPHFDKDGKFIGCKVRRGSNKISMPGSSYSALYGSWLGRRNKKVLLTEGEADAVYAAQQAADLGIPLDVFSLPSGANQPINPEWLDFLKGTDTLFLSFDPDLAGINATRTWIDEITRVGGITRDLRICVLPSGHDLRDAKPNLHFLLDNARRPMLGPDDLTGDLDTGRFIYSNINTGLPRVITNWMVEPVAVLTEGENPGYDVFLHYRGQKDGTTITLQDLSTVANIKKWATKHGVLYTGNDKDLGRIAEWIEARASVVPEVFQTEQVGAHSPPRHYSFAGSTIVYPRGYTGKLPFRYAPSGKTSDVTGRVLLPAETDDFYFGALDHFLNLSSSDVMHPFLAWLIASSRRHQVQNFPLLFIGGSSGVGKSTLARFGLRLMGSDIEIDLGGTTKFVLMKTLAATTSIPIFIDEWTTLSGQEVRLAFKGNIPIIYTGGLAQRGQQDLTTMDYHLTSPVIVAGEDTFVLDRERERMVQVFPSRAKQNKEANAALAHIQIETFAQSFHSWLTTVRALPPMPDSNDNRTEYNMEILLAGWATLHEYLDHMAGFGYDTPTLPDSPDLTTFLQPEQEQPENVYLQAVLDGAPLRDASGNPVVWADTDGRGTWVIAKNLIGAMARHGQDSDLPGGHRAMINYFREYYTVEWARVKLPLGSWTRAYLIHGLELPHGEEVDADGPVF